MAIPAAASLALDFPSFRGDKAGTAQMAPVQGSSSVSGTVPRRGGLPSRIFSRRGAMCRKLRLNAVPFGTGPGHVACDTGSPSRSDEKMSDFTGSDLFICRNRG